MASPQASTPLAVRTYHCLCNSLLLATTHTLSQLPRRAKGAIDRAIILPVRAFPSASESAAITAADALNALEEDGGEKGKSADVLEDLPQYGYTVLLSMNRDRRHTIVRREDGFDKRLLYRCGRCRLVVGYELDEAHWEVKDTGDEEGDTRMEGMDAKDKIIYILPGGLQSTEAMAEGRKIKDDETELGQGRPLIAVWE